MPYGIAQTDGSTRATGDQKTKVRWLILAMPFVITAVDYADRSTIAIAGPVISKDLGLNAAQMGIVFSAFGWAYVVAQLPGGWLLDRYGSKTVYACSLALWSMFTIAQGFVGFLTGGFTAVMSDAAPREITGVAGAVFNMCGNLSSITTPLVIGAIIQSTGSFNGALVFVAANGLVAGVSYLLVVGEIKRMVLVR